MWFCVCNKHTHKPPGGHTYMAPGRICPWVSTISGRLPPFDMSQRKMCVCVCVSPKIKSCSERAEMFTRRRKEICFTKALSRFLKHVDIRVWFYSVEKSVWACENHSSLKICIHLFLILKCVQHLVWLKTFKNVISNGKEETNALGSRSLLDYGTKLRLFFNAKGEICCPSHNIESS